MNTIRFVHRNSSAADTDLEFDYFDLDLSVVRLLLTVLDRAGMLTDANADLLHDDVNGNGRRDTVDVFLYFNRMNRIADHEPVSAFDYNGNGWIEFGDVVWLFNHPLGPVSLFPFIAGAQEKELSN